MVFLNRMFTVFFDCPNPASTPAKPRCIKNTIAVANIIHRLLAVNKASAPMEAASATFVVNSTEESVE